MKTQIILLGLIAISQSHILLAPAPVAQTQTSNNDCMALLIAIAMEATELVTAIKQGDMAKAEALFMDLAQKVYQEYKCFTDNEIKDVLITAAQIVGDFKGDRRQCYIDHLKQAVGKFRDGLFALFHGRMEEFQRDMHQVTEILQDAKQNC